MKDANQKRSHPEMSSIGKSEEAERLVVESRECKKKKKSRECGGRVGGEWKLIANRYSVSLGVIKVFWT